MISIDTNVLVRILVNDSSSPEQNDLARSLITQARQAFVSQVVQVETIWVLESTYQFSKEQILSVLELMKSSSALQLQSPKSFASAVEAYRTANADFSDCIILSESKNQGAELWTFDRKLGNMDNANRLTTENFKTLTF